MDGILLLEDGTVFQGKVFGAAIPAVGEVVFNTGMVGYQEILTDPSYREQIVAMTFPHIGNYGLTPEDSESGRPHLAGFVVREYSERPSNWRSAKSVADYLKERGIPGLTQVDTRRLTRHIREHGAMKAIMAPGAEPSDELRARLTGYPGHGGRDLVSDVSCASPYVWSDTTPSLASPLETGSSPPSENLRVVVYDFGVKRQILRSLVDVGFHVTVLPASTSREEGMAHEPDGVVFSNGPGDPAGLGSLVKIVGSWIGRVPVFGICLGHQLLARAFGLETYKLKFGHHGCNHPVAPVKGGQIWVTSQNHGYAVNVEGLGSQESEFEPTLKNLNDGTNEGLRHRELPVMSVQFHPEAAPGTHDAQGLFLEFSRLISGES